MRMKSCRIVAAMAGTAVSFGAKTEKQAPVSVAPGQFSAADLAVSRFKVCCIILWAVWNTKMFEKQQEERGVPGLSVCVVLGDRVVWRAGRCSKNSLLSKHYAFWCRVRLQRPGEPNALLAGKRDAHSEHQQIHHLGPGGQTGPGKSAGSGRSCAELRAGLPGEGSWGPAGLLGFGFSPWLQTWVRLPKGHRNYETTDESHVRSSALRKEARFGEAHPVAIVFFNISIHVGKGKMPHL